MANLDPTPRTFTFWFHNNVAYITLTATNRDGAWAKLIQAIKTNVPTTQATIPLDGGAEFHLADIDDEGWWEHSDEDEARERIMDVDL